MRIVTAALSAFALLQVSSMVVSQPIRQSCTGVLITSADGYQLKPDPGSDPWCDSIISQENVQKVLNACTIGHQCRIVGTVRGHGIFYWTKISLASSIGQLPDVSGKWRPIGSDNRMMTIKLAHGEMTIDAIDLSCKMNNLKPPKNPDPASLPSFTANAVCDDESDTLYSKENFSLLKSGREVYLIDATILLRRVNENEEPKVNETYSNEPANTVVYRKVRDR